MSEQPVPDETPSEAQVEVTSAAAPLESTGEPGVDRILETVRDVETLPLPEQVAAYESVQTELRGMLDGPRQPAPPQIPSSHPGAS